jgi:hypothetical protein
MKSFITSFIIISLLSTFANCQISDNEKVSKIYEKIVNSYEKISNSVDQALAIHEIFSEIYESLSNGFKIHGLNGCESTPVPRVQYEGEKLGEMFYSFKLNKKNGYIVEKGLVSDYVKIPLHTHQYGWYYRNFHAEKQEDLGDYYTFHTFNFLAKNNF